MVELMRRINLGELDLDNMKFTAEDLAKLIELAENGKISKDNRKIILREMLETGKKPETIAEEQQLWIKEDNALLEKTINGIMEANPKAVEQYRSGETKVFGSLWDSATRHSRERLHPQV